jgi:hypothetical protein
MVTRHGATVKAFGVEDAEEETRGEALRRRPGCVVPPL